MIGDEKRTFQVVLHMVGYLLSIFDGRGSFIFRVSSESESDGKNDKTWGLWRTDEYTSIKFEIEIIVGGSSSDGSSSAIEFSCWKHSSNENKESLSFSMCKKLVQVRILDILFIFHLLFFCTSSERNFCLIKNRIIIGIFILALHFLYCSFLFSFLFSMFFLVTPPFHKTTSVPSNGNKKKGKPFHFLGHMKFQQYLVLWILYFLCRTEAGFCCLCVLLVGTH